MIATMAFYAYVGEKVPWLIIAQLLPMCFVATYKLNWQKTAFALAGCIFLVVMTWHVAFVPVDINEPIVQVQNSEEMREVMGLMDNSRPCRDRVQGLLAASRGITGATSGTRSSSTGVSRTWIP